MTFISIREKEERNEKIALFKLPKMNDVNNILKQDFPYKNIYLPKSNKKQFGKIFHIMSQLR